jgi:hypothetical protein
LKYCPRCSTVNGDELKWCQKCGNNLVNEPKLRSAADFNNEFDQRHGRALHRRHRWLSLQIALLCSTLLHLVLLGGLASIRGWTLAYLILIGIGVTLVIHKTRLGHLSTIGLMFGLTFAGAAVGGVFHGVIGFLPFIFAMWMLSFWYVFLGHQLRMNNDLHR